MTSGGGDELLIRAALRDELTGPLQAIRAEISKAGSEVEKAGGRANIGARGFDKMASGAARLAKSAGRAGLIIGGGVVAALTAVTVWGAKSAITLQTATMNLTTLTGSAKVATKMVRELNKYGNATTFDTGPLAQAAQQMLTYGIATKDVLPDMKMLGDIAMGNQDKLSQLAFVFAQVQGNGHLMGQDLNQMINAGFNPLSDMAKRTGRSMGDLRKEMAAGNISFNDVVKSMQNATKKGGEFYKGASNGSKTVAGAWGNLTGTISSELGMAMQPVLPLIQATFGKVSDYASSKSGAIKKGIRSAVGDIQDLVLAGSMGPDQFANVLGSKMGVDLVGPLHKVQGIARDVGKIISGSVVPAFRDLGGAAGGLLSPVTKIDDVLHFMAGHTTTTKVAIEGLVGALTAAKLITIGVTAVTKAKSAADAVSLFWLKAHTVGTKTQVIWSGAVAAATGAWTGAQWLLNAALTANPIGLIIAGIAALVVGIVIAYKHSETFRKIVGEAFHYVGLAVGWLMDRLGDLLGALGHIKGFGWAKDAAEFLHNAADATRSFADTLKNAAGQAHAATGPTKLLADQLDRLHDKTVTIRTVHEVSTLSKIAGMNAAGDTATSHARGRGNLSATYAAHHAALAATGARAHVTNALIGGGGYGRGSGDHQAGRALDLQGKGLGRYGAHMRALGGYAAFHGTGSSRHLHVVPPAMGDTATSRVRTRPGPSAAPSPVAPVVIAPGAIVIQNPANGIDLERAVAAGIRTYLRDEKERS